MAEIAKVWPQMSRIQYIPLPGKNPEPYLTSFYDKAYEFWHHLWKHTFEEVGDSQTLHSDDFLRQDEIAGIFYDEKPVGLFLYNWMNLKHRATQDHSYMKNYPNGIFQNLLSQGHSKVMFMGYLTVHPNWRRSTVGFSLADILLGLAVKRFLASTATALVSFTRNDRKVHDLVYRFGAQPLLKDHVAHNIPSDIIAIYRDSTKECPFPEIPPYTNHLWKTQKDVSTTEFLRLHPLMVKNEENVYNNERKTNEKNY